MVTAARRVPPSAAKHQESSGYRGAEGRRKMVEEEERATARREASMQMSNMPFRFYCPVGETRQYIVVDHEPDFFRFEHNLKNNRSGKWDIFCACINENANCPVCKEAERPSYFAMYLTIVDLTPYESSTGETVEWSKKLLVVKPAQQKKFTRFFERHGTLRGMLIEATRDGEKDAAIGNDQEFVEFVPEEELLTYETQYTDKKDKVHDVIGHEIFDYDELFPMPTEQQLRALVGGRPEAGARDDDDRSTGRRTTRGSSGDDWDKGSKAAPARRGRAAPAEEEEEPPRRPLARRAAAPVEEPEEEAEEAPRARAGRLPPPASRTPTRAAPARRAAREEPAEDEAEDEEPPPRSRAAPSRAAPSSLADKRRALRR